MKTLRILLITFTPCLAALCSSTELHSFGKTVVAIGEKAATDALNQWIEDNSK